MNRRTFLSSLAGVSAVSLLGLSVSVATRAANNESAPDAENPPPAKFQPLKKSQAEWQQLLSPAAYAVLFEEATEAAGSSPLDKEYGKGIYLCAACFLPLFDSDKKFDSGTGWPSFWQPIAGHIGTRKDYKLIWPRTEYHCLRCGGHQGHVFDDGPKPTGKRYCNNGIALRFVPAGESLPALRT